MLKYLSIAFILVLLAVACNNNPAQDNNANRVDSIKVNTTVKKDTLAARLWIIKDSSMYSKQFLKELYDIKIGNNDSISLVDNYIINGKDTVYFPDYFDGNKQYLFETIQDSVDYKLQIFNCTYIKVQFIFSATKNNKLVQHYYGEAEIAPRFFMDTTTNVGADSKSYPVFEYKGENEKYLFELSIGADGNKLLGRFYAHAKDSVQNQSFNVCLDLLYAGKYAGKHKR